MNIYDTLKKISASLIDSINAGYGLSDLLAWANSDFDTDLLPDSLQASMLLDKDHTISFVGDSTLNTLSITGSQLINNVQQDVEYIIHKGDDLNPNLPFDAFGISSMYDLSSKVQQWIASNATVSGIIDMVSDSDDGCCNQTALLNFVDSITSMIGVSTASTSLKAFIASAGESIFPEHLVGFLQGLYLDAGKNNGRATSSDEQKLIDTLPSVDEFNWTIVGQVFASIGQAIGWALTLIAKPLGLALAVAGSLTSTILSIAFGDENYGITRANNGYLNIPIDAQVISTPSAPDSDVIVFRSLGSDTYKWTIGGKSYINSFLKPFVSDSEDGLAFRFEDYFTSSIPTYAGSSVCGTIARDHAGSHFGVDINRTPQVGRAIYDHNVMGDLSRANIAVWNALAATILGQNAGLLYFLPPDFNTMMQVYSYEAILPGAVPDHFNNFYHLSGYLVSLGYTFAFAPSNAYLYTKDLANLIAGFRDLISSDEDPYFGMMIWNYATRKNDDFSTSWYWYSCNGGTAPASFANVGTTYPDQGIKMTDLFKFSFVFAPNPALFYLEYSALAYNANTNPSSHAEAISSTSSSVRQLPRTFSYTFPSATLLGKFLMLGATVVSLALIAGAVAYTTVKIRRAVQRWRTKKILAIDQLKQNAQQSGDPTDIDNYIKAARGFNFVNTFLPGSTSYNLVSGWAENSASAGSTSGAGKLSTATGLSDIIHLISGK